MKKIIIDGVIGWDVIASDVRRAFDEATDDGEVDLTISSPGGSVYEGLAIFNTIRDFRREGGTVTARVIGLAASMATYIPLAADRVLVEDNAVWMIHNPWSIAMGNQNDLRKEANILDSIAAVLAKGYAAKTGKDFDELRGMMDAETWLFGDEIISAGFAESVEPAGEGAESREEAVAVALTTVEAMKHTMQAEPERQQLDKAAALIPLINGNKSGVAGMRTAAQAEINEEGAMDIKALEKEHPDVFAEAVQIGANTERERITALREWTEADPENVKLAEVIELAIAEGKSVDQISAKLHVAVRDGKNSGENPPHVETDTTQDPLSDDDVQAAKLAGMTIEEYRKYSKEGE